ncbi:MAG: type I methionyl aminopeptidase [Clostridia bacterium]|nr:type I methionyl aminopeptidase [Clostridia bacterium]MBQ8369124.1 type I methionyl aminopeptidase [Clostridia bacterium]
MIQVKNAAQIAMMRDAGKITGEALAMAGEMVRPGITTKEIDTAIREYITKSGATPSFLNYGGFPASACISINDEVIHGIPSKKKILRDGDIVKIDVGAYYKGYHGDSANTFPVGNVSEEAMTLIRVTKESFLRGIETIGPGSRLGDLGAAVDGYVRQFGFSAVRKFVGHGVGRDLHEAPDVPNYGIAGRGQRIYTGMVIAVEPMINAGTYDVIQLDDGWTVKTADGKLSAHYEHTLAVTDNGVVLLTKV